MIKLANGCLLSGDDDDDGDEDDDGEKEEVLPSCGDYVMHYLSLFWKLLFATVPPTGKPFFTGKYVHI